MKKVKYLIIGAGISGLSFACQKKDDDYLIIERDSVCGGLCQSFYDQGFVWDVAGHFYHFHSEETKEYFQRLMRDKPMSKATKCAKVYYKGQFMDAPFQYNIHQLPSEEFIECLTDLYYSEDDTQATSFDEFVRRKYGNGIAEKFLIPYNEKLYACKMNELEQEAMGVFLPKLDFSMLMSFYRGKKGKTYNDTFDYPINGCVEFINCLLDQLDRSRIHLNEEVLSVNTTEMTVKTSTVEYTYEYLINTAPLNAFARMAGETFDGLNYNQVLVLNLGFDMESIDKYVSWIYFPGDEFFYRIGFYNNIAGTERLSLYVEIGYKAGEVIDVEEALRKTLTDLHKIGITTDHKLLAWKPYIINPGYAHITSEGRRFTDNYIAELKHKNVHMVGRYARWEYSAMDDAIEQAQILALEI